MVALPHLWFPTCPITHPIPPHPLLTRPLPIDSTCDITGAEPTIRKSAAFKYVATVQTSYNLLNGTCKQHTTKMRVTLMYTQNSSFAYACVYNN